VTKLFQADAALVGLLASVDAHVHGEGAELGEGAVAEGALVRFLAGVNALVNLQVAQVAEGTVAVSALVQIFLALAILADIFDIFEVFLFHWLLIVGRSGVAEALVGLGLHLAKACHFNSGSLELCFDFDFLIMAVTAMTTTMSSLAHFVFCVCVFASLKSRISSTASSFRSLLISKLGFRLIVRVLSVCSFR